MTQFEFMDTVMQQYAGDLLMAADECVKMKVSQQSFHDALLSRRAILEKTCPQEKSLIAEAVNSIAAKLSEMEAGLENKPRPAPKSEMIEKRRQRFPRNLGDRKHKFPEPL